VKGSLLSTGLALFAALLLAGAGGAHLSVTPGLLESGREATLRIELPELRPGLRPSALDVSGPGVRLLESSREGRLAQESRWRVRVDVATAPGPLKLRLRARYADGLSVTVTQSMTVLPAAGAAATRSSWRGLPAAAVVLALLGACAAIFLVRRGRGRG